MKNKYVGITMGDPAGVGPEIALKAIEEHSEFKNSTIIYGSYDILKYYHDLLHISTPMVKIERPEHFQNDKINQCKGFQFFKIHKNV